MVGFQKPSTQARIPTEINIQNDRMMEVGVKPLPSLMAGGTDLAKKVVKAADGQLHLHQQVETIITTVDHMIRMAIPKTFLQKRGQLKEIISMRWTISRARARTSSSTSVRLKLRPSRTDRKLQTCWAVQEDQPNSQRPSISVTQGQARLRNKTKIQRLQVVASASTSMLPRQALILSHPHKLPM